MKVLLTNDDGIDAEGLQELRRALLRVPDIELVVIAPDGNRSAMARSITTRRPLWVQEVDFGDGTHGFATDGTPGRLRAPRDARARRGLRGAAHRLGHQPRDEPRRRHHVLRHGRGGVRGRPARACRRSRSRSSRRRARRTSGPTTSSSSSAAAQFVARLVEEIDDVPLPPGTLLNINCPAGEAERRRDRASSASASTATS